MKFTVEKRRTELEKESLVGSFAPAAGWARELKHLVDHAGE